MVGRNAVDFVMESQAAGQDQRERRGCRGTMMLSAVEKRFTCKQKDMTTFALKLCALHPM